MRFDQMLDCKNTHAGIFKFNCTHCDYKTNKTKAFKNHITIHSQHGLSQDSLDTQQSQPSPHTGSSYGARPPIFFPYFGY